jgi:hypothetical protein
MSSLRPVFVLTPLSVLTLTACNRRGFATGGDPAEVGLTSPPPSVQSAARYGFFSR